MIDDNLTRKNGVTLITTNINPDFDAFASVLAAQKIYTDSLVFIPEPKKLNFFFKSLIYLYNLIDLKDIEPYNVRKLILVNTRKPTQIKKVLEIINSDTTIHIYDHHPPAPGDIIGTSEIVEPFGATVTILSGIIQERMVSIGPDEATIMCLGVYEKTGSLSFPSTTDKDLSAAAFFLKKGANINIISNLINKELNSTQIKVLNDLLFSITRHNINGIDIFIAKASDEQTIPDFAFLVNKMIKIENLDNAFAIARMGNKIHVSARSHTSDIDVGDILSAFGAVVISIPLPLYLVTRPYRKWKKNL